MSGPEPFTEGGSTPTSVEQWLTEIRLEEYADAFKAAGLTTLVKVSQMTDADLESAGVVKMGHRKKLMIRLDTESKMNKIRHGTKICYER